MIKNMVTDVVPLGYRLGHHTLSRVMISFHGAGGTESYKQGFVNVYNMMFACQVRVLL